MSKNKSKWRQAMSTNIATTEQVCDLMTSLGIFESLLACVSKNEQDVVDCGARVVARIKKDVAAYHAQASDSALERVFIPKALCARYKFVLDSLNAIIHDPYSTHRYDLISELNTWQGAANQKLYEVLHTASELSFVVTLGLSVLLAESIVLTVIFAILLPYMAMPVGIAAASFLAASVSTFILSSSFLGLANKAGRDSNKVAALTRQFLVSIEGKSSVMTPDTVDEARIVVTQTHEKSQGLPGIGSLYPNGSVTDVDGIKKYTATNEETSLHAAAPPCAFF